jgi:hypothetical protein
MMHAMRHAKDQRVEWLAEAKRRLEAVRSGHATLIPTEEVERELQELILDHVARSDDTT